MNDAKLTALEYEYLSSLITQDLVLNSHKHGAGGLYSEFDAEFTSFIYALKAKLKKITEEDDE
jgi:hypothetical protein